METTVRGLDLSSPREYALVRDFLARRDIRLDDGLTYTAGLFDEDGALLATGSILGNTLRSLAVREDRAGEGLMNTLVSHLMDIQAARGVFHVFLYTKCAYSAIFSSLGFYEIARAEPFAVLMENRRRGFSEYLLKLKNEAGAAEESAAIVMNANPMTLGHVALLKKAAEENARVHLFVVSEDRSLVPFKARLEIVRQTAAAFKQVTVHETDSYLVSAATFPSYFIKADDDVSRAHAMLDAEVFARIAAELGITSRYLGTEPYSHTTDTYNAVLLKRLPARGVSVRLVERAKGPDGAPLSASRVRELLRDGGAESARAFVPQATYRYFLSDEGRAVIEKMRAARDVIHH